MNQVIKELTERKSVRVFENKPIDDKTKELILEAAIQAPTAGNQQLYSIIDVTDETIKQKLSIACDNQPFIAQAPMVEIFLADSRKWLGVYKLAGISPRKPGTGDLMISLADAIIAAQNSVTAAWSMGVGSCYIGDIVEQYETITKLLKLPDYVFPAALVVYGYPTDQQMARTKPLRQPRKITVFTNQYKELDNNEYAEMIEHYLNNKDYSQWVKAFYTRKYGSDFCDEMSRSVNLYLAQYSQDE